MRIRILKNVFTLLFLLLLFDLFRLQIINGPRYLRQSENNRIRLVPEEAPRGIIYDCNSKPLVRNELIFDLVAVAQEVRNKDTLFKRLAELLDISADNLSDAFAHNQSSFLYPVMLAENIPRHNAFIIEQEKLQLPGMYIRPRIIRNYTYTNSTAHILGYIGQMRESDYPELKKYGYRIQDVIGRNGIERRFDVLLRGKPGGMQLEVDSRGRIIRNIAYKPPLRGEDLTLTIDINLQNYVCELVNENRGAVGVMDTDSGEILALYSGPSYDPNTMIAHKQTKEINEILNDSRSPLINRNLHTYAPGSIFKIVTAYTGLVKKKFDQRISFECGGEYRLGKSTFDCWLKRGHGLLDLENAIATSCNVFFYQLGLQVGVDDIAKQAKEFGFGATTGIELPEENKGLVPNTTWKRFELNEKWYAGDTVNFSIGQGYLLITPLQALKMVSLVANGGKSINPHIVKSDNINIAQKKVLDQKVLNVIKQGMEKVVSADYGTGHRAFIEDVKIYGKTGTAQVGGRQPHAWFVGFAKVNQKTISLVVFMEHGGHGGEQPAEIARNIFLFLKDAKRGL